MSITTPFKFNKDAEYPVGFAYSSSHQFSLVHQLITIKKGESFEVHFPSIWQSYKLPQVKEPEIYNTWTTNQMQYWQNQLNFAVWCATSGCGVCKLDHLQHKNPMIRSMFRFHAYYQIRHILSEMECSLPMEDSLNTLNNAIKGAFEQVFSEFGISPESDFTQKLDNLQGLGSVRYYSLHGLRSKQTKVLERGDYDPSQHWTVFILAS